jgi:DNA-binding MarR family transcriptional regulator
VSEPSAIPEPLLIGALLHDASESVRRAIVEGLVRAGFEDFRPSHLAAMQYPSPEGVSPLVLARRAGISKQAMNAVLESLETLGYLVRGSDPTNGRARVVRLTKRGQKAFVTMRVILADIETDWAARLGPKRFAELQQMLREQWRFSHRLPAGVPANERGSAK